MATLQINSGQSSNILDSDVKKRFITNINNNPYRYNIGLITSDGRYQELRVGAINSLVILDNFANFYHEGYIIINNTFDAVERLNDFQRSEQLQTAKTFTQTKGYLMRGDSRDLLVIDIMPILEENSDYSIKSSEDAEKAFKLSFTFAIYNSEEIQGNAPGEKFKKLYFWDIHYELLREKNSYFSTADSIDSDNISSLGDNDRGILTGDAIKTFLLDFFKEEDGWPITVDDETFDTGSTDIFFSAPARFKGIDCLEYLLDRHASSSENNFDRAFLRIERNSSNFAFESLKDIFKSAIADTSNQGPIVGAGYLETFKLGLYSETSNDWNLNQIDFTPAGALFLDKYGTINNFAYDPMPGEISQKEIAGVLVHSYDHDCKQFQIDQQRNTINASLSVYKENYVDVFNKVSQKNTKIYENIFPGEYRTANKNVRHAFTVISDSDDQRLTQGRNKVLFNSVYMNSAITFRVPGSTHRQAGKFIGINFDGASPDSEFNRKLLGVYFVVSVKHMFSGNEYFNEIKCIKTYNYENLLLSPGTK